VGATRAFVLLLLDYWPLERLTLPPRRAQFGRLIGEKAPLLVMSAAASLLTMMAQGGPVL
jgi:hypothetical protein